MIDVLLKGIVCNSFCLTPSYTHSYSHYGPDVVVSARV